MQNAPRSIEDFVATITESGRYRCPECSSERKKSSRLELKVTVEQDKTLYHCHHCDLEGVVAWQRPHQKQAKIKKTIPEPKPITHLPTPLNNSRKIIANFFKVRGIDVTQVDYGDAILTDNKWYKDIGEEIPSIGFAYKQIDDTTQAIKYRPADPTKKLFTQDGAARMFYGLRPMQKDEEQIIIVEGEADVIALASIGIESWSIPNGAPPKLRKGKIDPEEDVRFAYVWDAWDEISTAKKIILATDEDAAGNVLKQELSRRIGLEKCWEILVPEGSKDVTDVIRNQGSDYTKNLFTNARPMPLKGVYDVQSYFEDVELLYKDGMVSGESTGLPSVDDLFRIKEGMLYIVTGFPGHGKSEFIDEIMVNLAKNHHWKWAIASFENLPPYHIPKLMEKYVEKPFYEGRSQRLSYQEMCDAKDFLGEHFVFIEQKDGSMATIKDIMAKIRLAIARCGVRGAVIDPYNYINMSEYENEHIGITQMLSELSAFARANDVAIFFVAHPQKLMPGQDGLLPVPTGSHISGSAAWWAKADIGMTVFRKDHEVEIHCWKARFKWLGQIGKQAVSYDIVTGKYSDKGVTKAAQWSEFNDIPDF